MNIMRIMKMGGAHREHDHEVKVYRREKRYTATGNEASKIEKKTLVMYNQPIYKRKKTQY